MKYFERIAEEVLQEAVNRGDFDHLPNAGQKIDYQEYVSMPAGVRLMHRLFKDSGTVPMEVELLRELGIIREKLARKDLSEEQRAKLRKLLAAKLIERDLRMKRTEDL